MTQKPSLTQSRSPQFAPETYEQSLVGNLEGYPVRQSVRFVNSGNMGKNKTSPGASAFFSRMKELNSEDN